MSAKSPEFMNNQNQRMEAMAQKTQFSADHSVMNEDYADIEFDE